MFEQVMESIRPGREFLKESRVRAMDKLALLMPRRNVHLETCTSRQRATPTHEIGKCDDGRSGLPLPLTLGCTASFYHTNMTADKKDS